MPGKRFSSNEEEITTLKAYFDSLRSRHFRDGTHKLEDRWNMCIQFQGEYLEK